MGLSQPEGTTMMTLEVEEILGDPQEALRLAVDAACVAQSRISSGHKDEAALCQNQANLWIAIHECQMGNGG